MANGRRPANPYRDAILKTLLYYDIWDHPLTAEEIYTYLPVNSVHYEQFRKILSDVVTEGRVRQIGKYYLTPLTDPLVVPRREAKARHAHRLWRIARLSMHLIKRFPFVRAVFVSGDLSKGVTSRASDIDFFIITSPNRLWIARTLLILFKKIFLLNKKKFFCVNYFTTEDHLTINERNIYIATEIASLQPLYNFSMFEKVLDKNRWITSLFPNFHLQNLHYRPTSERRSIIQMFLELLFVLVPADRIDRFLMQSMERIWASRYAEIDAPTRNRIFLTTRQESRAFAGNFEDRILRLYTERLRRFGFAPRVRPVNT